MREKSRIEKLRSDLRSGGFIHACFVLILIFVSSTIAVFFDLSRAQKREINLTIFYPVVWGFIIVMTLRNFIIMNYMKRKGIELSWGFLGGTIFYLLIMFCVYFPFYKAASNNPNYIGFTPHYFFMIYINDLFTSTETRNKYGLGRMIWLNFPNIEGINI